MIILFSTNYYPGQHLAPSMESAIRAAKETFPNVKVNRERCNLLLQSLLETGALEPTRNEPRQDHSDRLTLLRNVSDM